MINARTSAGLVALLVLGLWFDWTEASQREASEHRLALPAAAFSVRPVAAEPKPITFDASTPAGVRSVLAAMRGSLADDLAALERLASTSEDPLVVGNALATIGRTRSPHCYAFLRGFLNDRRPRVRQEAIRSIGLCGGSGASLELSGLAQGLDETSALLSIQALASIGDEAALHCLELIATSGTSDRVRREFARHQLARARGSLQVREIASDSRAGSSSR